MFKSIARKNFQVWHIVAGMVALQLSFCFLTIYHGLGFDESVWHYIGRNWFRNGLVPYSGGVDNKSPLMYAIYGISDLLFGVNYWFPRLLAISFQTLGIYYVYLIGKHIGDKRSGVIAMVIYGFSLLWHGTEGKTVSLTQAYEIAFSLIALYYYLTAQNKKHFFISGVIAAIAVAFRFSACIIIVTILASMLKRRSNPVLFLAGLLAGILLIISLLMIAGIKIQDLFAYSFLDNFSAGSITSHDLAWKLEQFTNQFFYSEMILFYPLVLAYLWIKKSIDIFLFWLIAAFCMIAVIGMFARTHLKELLPQLSLISAFSIRYLLSSYKIPVKPPMLILAICFFPKTLEPFWALKNISWGRHDNINDQEEVKEDDDYKKKLGLWIKSNTKAEEKVFVAGYGPQVLCYAERQCPSIYFTLNQTNSAKRRLFSDLLSENPAVIAIPVFPAYREQADPDIRAFINNIISKNYYLDTCLYSYDVFKINFIKPSGKR